MPRQRSALIAAKAPAVVSAILTSPGGSASNGAATAGTSPFGMPQRATFSAAGTRSALSHLYLHGTCVRMNIADPPKPAVGQHQCSDCEAVMELCFAGRCQCLDHCGFTVQQAISVHPNACACYMRLAPLHGRFAHVACLLESLLHECRGQQLQPTAWRRQPSQPAPQQAQPAAHIAPGLQQLPQSMSAATTGLQSLPGGWGAAVQMAMPQARQCH